MCCIRWICEHRYKYQVHSFFSAHWAHSIPCWSCQGTWTRGISCRPHCSTLLWVLFYSFTSILFYTSMSIVLNFYCSTILYITVRRSWNIWDIRTISGVGYLVSWDLCVDNLLHSKTSSQYSTNWTLRQYSHLNHNNMYIAINKIKVSKEWLEKIIKYLNYCII